MKTKELIRQLVREVFQVTDEHLTEKTEKLEELFELLSYKEVDENTEFPTEDDKGIIIDWSLISDPDDPNLSTATIFLDDENYNVTKIIEAALACKPIYLKVIDDLTGENKYILLTTFYEFLDGEQPGLQFKFFIHNKINYSTSRITYRSSGNQLLNADLVNKVNFIECYDVYILNFNKYLDSTVKGSWIKNICRNADYSGGVYIDYENVLNYIIDECKLTEDELHTVLPTNFLSMFDTNLSYVQEPGGEQPATANISNKNMIVLTVEGTTSEDGFSLVDMLNSSINNDSWKISLDYNNINDDSDISTTITINFGNNVSKTYKTTEEFWRNIIIGNPVD